MMNWLKRNFVTLILVLIMMAGGGLIAYPSVADWWNNFNQAKAVASYASAVADLSKEDYDALLNAAYAYNEKLAETGIDWDMSADEMKEYNSLLNIGGNGIIGYIDINKIRVQLPIYHGTDDDILQIAIGHIAGSSLPVGGEGTHCIVSGHRGLPSARLFTDLDKLVVGDTWTMNILDQTLTYEVDKIRVVLPADLSDLQIEEGKDYCTLVTCTPYGVNTHRLLVRGHRIANAQGNARVTADALQIDPVYVAPFVAAPMLVILIIAVLISTRRSKTRTR